MFVMVVMKKFLSILLLLISFHFCNDAIGKELKFAQISDIHYSYSEENKSNDSYTQYLKQAIKDINKKRDIKFVIFTGDNINTGTKKDYIKFLKIANKLNKPYYLVAGNTDIAGYKGFNKKKYNHTIWLHHPQMIFKKTNYVFKPNRNIVFIVVDGTNDLIPSTSGYFKPNTLEWLDKKLQKYKNKKIIIVQHFPLIPPRKKTSFNTIETEKYFHIINSYDNVIAILSGHFHTDNTIYKKGIYHISAPAFKTEPHQYKIITVDYEPKYLFSNPAEFEIIQDTISIIEKTQPEIFENNRENNEQNNNNEAEGE